MNTQLQEPLTNLKFEALDVLEDNPHTLQTQSWNMYFKSLNIYSKQGCAGEHSKW